MGLIDPHSPETQHNHELQLALVAFTGMPDCTAGLVLYCYGHNIESNYEHQGPQASDLELGQDKDYPGPGLWVWEGYIRWEFHDTPDIREWDYTLETHRWRRPNAAEWFHIHGGKAPWTGPLDPPRIEVLEQGDEWQHISYRGRVFFRTSCGNAGYYENSHYIARDEATFRAKIDEDEHFRKKLAQEATVRQQLGKK